MTKNTGETGGALAQYHGKAEIYRTEITDNLASRYDGGGIYNGASVLTLTNSNVTENESNYGGGIRQEWDSQSIITESTISNNYAKISGGGVENGAFSTLTIFRSTVSGNVSDGGGGGITSTMAHNGTLIVSTTISGNMARTNGGGVLIWGEGLTTLTRSTVAFNHADSNGGGAHISGSPTVFSNTVVTGNTTNGSGPEINCTGASCSRYALVNHFNLFGHDGRSGLSGVSPGSRDTVPNQRIAAILDMVLENNGGPTATHALVPGSTAIDKGDPDFENVVYGRNDIYDQRGPGFPRLSGLHMDIGAFEAQP